MRKRSALLGLYLLLLLASHLVRWRARVEAPLPAGPAVDVPAVGGTGTVHLAYRQWAPPAVPDPPVVVLLHGSPGSSADFLGLGPQLATRYRVIAPDLPGFGRSSHRVPDYSIRAHARYVEALLARLGVEQAHLLGFSMGGGVALELVAQAQRVRSLTLLSAIGVQELELLGAYTLNHALHALQLGGLWLLHEAVPHFGTLDDALLNLPYAHNFYDTDQRPLRGILATLTVPTLVLHGRHDSLVPYAAAEEHYRLVPQSQLVTFEANHFLVFRQPDRLAPPILAFLEEVENGTAATRATAVAERRAAAAGPAPPLPRAQGFTLVLWVVLLAFATLISEDLTCITAGLSVADGRIGFLPAAAACITGIFIGDMLLYAAGRWLGRPWLRRAPLRWVVEADDVERSAAWFQARGWWVIFISRFIPGTRLPTYTAAGLLRTDPLWFAANLFVPVALWTPLLVGAAMVLGDRLFAAFALFERYALAGLLGLGVGLWLGLKGVRAASSHRGRRLLVGRLRRLRHWEFWPPWAFYPPVALYVLWLGLRYRGLTVFTAANPGIPAGGFIGESKAQILAALDPHAVARFQALPGGPPVAERAAAVAAFRDRHGFGWPVVLKPDVGQRGAGVVVARCRAEVDAFFATCPGDAIVQEHVEGPELGVFYSRLPGEAKGQIFSITDKRLPTVVGDGTRTLEQLLLDDHRAVAMAATYLAQLGERRDSVPTAGERVRLVELGTHCRGAIFLDGAAHATPALEAAIDRLSHTFEGFYFGRYDLRAPSFEAFRAGEGFRVLELNGVTSEATHIYDPKNSVFAAYGVLFRQWRLAFEIGHRNRARGTPTVGAGELIRRFLRYRRGGG